MQEQMGNVTRKMKILRGKTNKQTKKPKGNKKD